LAVIEGEQPPQDRIQRWGRAIGEAGRTALDENELLRLQKIVIGDERFVKLGFGDEGGFVGEHDRETGAPIPDHVSARPEDLASLLQGPVSFDHGAAESLDAVIAAAILAFGFVYIHPFEDGNGRISRYLIHDIYVRDGLTPAGFIFPVSAIILKRLKEYNEALEHHSKPIRELANYDFDPMTHEMRLHNPQLIEPLFRYPDLTQETLYLMRVTRECADVTLVRELDHLDRMERAKTALRETLDLPDRRLNLLLAMIHQNGGKLSANKRRGEFSDLDDQEVADAEGYYRTAFEQKVEQ